MTISNLPAEFTNEDGDKIFAYLKPFVDDGFIRAFQGNEYIQEFGSGDTWVSIVWSGDLANSGGPDDHFVYPTEGLVASTDNMLIPKGAVHRDAALAMIDHLYDVAIAARLAAGIKYISPVFGADEAIAAIDPELAENPLIFPPAGRRRPDLRVPGLRRREGRLLPGPHRPADGRVGSKLLVADEGAGRG